VFWHRFKKAFIEEHELPETFDFARYMRKCMRKVCMQILEIKIALWVVFMVCVALNVARIALVGGDIAGNIPSFIVAGYFVLLLTFILVFYCFLVIRKASHLYKNNQNPEYMKTLFFFHRPKIIIVTLEGLMLFQSGYMTVFIMQVGKSIVNQVPSGVSWLVIIIALIPPLVSVLFLIPRALPMYTLCTHVAEMTDEDLVAITQAPATFSMDLPDRDVMVRMAINRSDTSHHIKEKLYGEKLKELHSVKEKMESTRRKFDELRKKRLDEFMTGFSTINLKLKEMYQMITLGGDAELELVDSLDPFSEGIVFTVKPPKKSWKAITNLSGGEKTLASLSLVFALHHYKPTPLYVMDEIDAALDFRNVSIVANYIKERTKDAQFIVISLRNNMFEIADRLVGIYKTNNCTGSVTINPKQFAIQTVEAN